ncbi:mediator of RNA polymerase II transcription subunit 15 isoform X2 [Strongylocentrotus purpuratus]|uniref:Mediator of RNA polymerase II transcription subunit 15 n=1 Tax=Strongylocentrotus purpuratus TaxID=7668 RepID=A0A7M7N796_STRPU|nr:mediator of RNA polymerase II transcription subunit 15 isoform X2 [Strongylocentrotus purpuratus]|eukprot:XP_011679339.1 PREDICTED: mediator of RNA polymerase II transcription subunit 15 isoform X2 [Strongylocentrotus purpuratus]
MTTPGAGAMSAAAGSGGPDGNWRSTQFRSKVVAQINDALRDACNPIEKSGSELEEHIFNRARDRDSYLSLVARLILHMRDSNAAKEKGLTGRMTPNMAGQQQDPMVALQGLTQMGQSHSPGGPSLQMQPNPNQMVPGVGNQGNRPMMRNQMGQPQGGNLMDQRQQQQLQNLQKLMSNPSQPGGGGMAPGSGGMHQSQQAGQTQQSQQQPSQMPGHYQGGAVGGMQQTGFPGPPGGGGNMTPQPQTGGMPVGPQGGPNQMHGMQQQGGGQMGMPQNNMSQNNMMPQQQMNQMVRPQQNFQNTMVMQGQKPQAPIPPRAQVPRSYPVQSTPPIQSRAPMSPYGGYPYMMSPQSVVTDSPVYRQQPSPAQPTQQGSAPGSNAMHSPASYLQPSPSPQGLSIPSPASAGSQRGGPPSVPSPSSTLNTPGNPASVGSINPSPGGGMRGGPGSNQGQAELIAYQEKMRFLSKYIEPLKKTILANSNREESGGLSATDVNKMKGLLEIIANPNPNKRLTLQQLTKCEQYLEGFEQQLATSNSTSAAGTSTTATSASATSTLDTRIMGKTNMFQPLLDAVKANIDSPYINHTLQRTFGPALTTLQGNPSHFPSPPAKKLKTEHDRSPTTQTAIPNIIQGEVARLAPKFRVNLDPMFHTSSKDVHLICRLDDKHLPSVPPINVAIPEQYPELSPNYDVSQQEYGQTPFLKLVQAALQNQVMRMPDRYTLTQILDAWEMSVRKSCLKMIAARDAT